MDPVTHLLIENWTVDYGGGHVNRVEVPHAWRQDVPPAFEGPVVYRTDIEVPRKPSVLRFHGVSYSATVSIDGVDVGEHRGIWDSFDVSLEAFAGKRVQVEVKVVKNGGESFPVKDVASGFLPYVFHTFGGLYGEVELLDREEASSKAVLGAQRVRVDGRNIFVDDRPFYPRGLLHWGWYPELGHTNAPEDTIRAEVQSAKRLGFNLIKFCLWVPPHRYLAILQEEGMEAWLELPLWNPSDNEAKLSEIADEIERIVRQYRHHNNILCWTIGCELSCGTSAEYRQRLVQLVKNLTGSPLVKDNSGGAEMYGGDLREFGDFDDFHPYCDLPFYPVVLDSLLPGPRPSHPVLLGEFNDIDVHRDLTRIADDMPFWASSLPELNDQGVRWQYDLPNFMASNRFAQEPRKNKHRDLMESSRKKALFVRKYVQEAVRARESLSGFVITGLRDTPVSTAGFFDDWGDCRFSPEECLPWNHPNVLFQVPSRRPPWIHGGNRAGWVDTFNHFTGQVFFRIGLHSEEGARGGLNWRIVDSGAKVVAQGSMVQIEVPALGSREVGQISWHCDEPGFYHLQVEFGDAVNEWPVNVFNAISDTEKEEWKASGWLDGEAVKSPSDRIVCLTGEGTLPMPFWREAAYEFWGDSFGLAERWERLLAISSDRVLDISDLPEHEILIRRIDTRTYAEHAVAVRIDEKVITTLRPFGGLGVQPLGLARNPSGVQLLRDLSASSQLG